MNDSSSGEDLDFENRSEGRQKKNRKKLNQSHDRLEVNLDDIQDDNDQ